MAKQKMLWTRGLNSLLPDNDEAKTFISRSKQGDVIQCDMSIPRNGKFLRKYFSLLKVAYDNYPGENMSLEVFREQIIILAGYHTQHQSFDGRVILKAESISFAKMSETDFEKLYSRTIDVILEKVLPGTSAGEIDSAVMEVIGFA